MSVPSGVLEQFVRELVAEEVERQLAERDALATADNGRRWLTLAEAGERLGCSPDAIRMRVKRGRLEHRRQGARLYVAAASVQALGGKAYNEPRTTNGPGAALTARGPDTGE